LHELAIREQFVREVAIEHHPFPRQTSEEGYTGRELVDEINVIRGRGVGQQMGGEVQLPCVREEDVEFTAD
jgi:hypothetical protein